MRSYRLGGVCRIGCHQSAPALLMRMSRRPKRSIVASTIALTSSSWRTSTRTARADPPAASTSAATVWMLPGSFSVPLSALPVITTAAPSRASRSAIARPMPRLDPVTTATRPWSGPSAFIAGHDMRLSGDQRAQLVDDASELPGQGARQPAHENVPDARVIPELQARVFHGESIPDRIALDAQVGEDRARVVDLVAGGYQERIVVGVGELTQVRLLALS